ncbi:hypothetical protein TNCV_5066121 [Trichonephila clavipes]|nr:hypothetical protein TNCV_5066121 [Trichonephila clavipes]
MHWTFSLVADHRIRMWIDGDGKFVFFRFHRCNSQEEKKKKNDTTTRCFRKPYTQLNGFESGRIVGMSEAGWSYRAIGRHLQRCHHHGGYITMVVTSPWLHHMVFRDESRFILESHNHNLPFWRDRSQ